jgi:hypothetical protein
LFCSHDRSLKAALLSSPAADLAQWKPLILVRNIRARLRA